MLQDKTILIAEDNLDLSQLFQQCLKSEGAFAITARNGREALELVKTNKPDLILLDVMLPEINGFDVLTALKENSDTKDIPVIVSTVLTGSDILEKAKKLGAIDYVVKSDILPQELVEKIKTILSGDSEYPTI